MSSHGFNGEEDPDVAQSVVVKMWHNGFSLDDGPLRPYNDPDSLEFMAAIKQGRIPPVRMFKKAVSGVSNWSLNVIITGIDLIVTKPRGPCPVGRPP